MLRADRLVPTICPYCGVGCQINLHIEDDLIYRIDRVDPTAKIPEYKVCAVFLENLAANGRNHYG